MSISDLVKSFGPIITASVTILVFYLTTRRDRKKDERKTTKERLSKVKYLNHVTVDALKTINKQADALDHHLASVKENKFTQVPLSYYNKHSCELLVSLISHEQTFFAVAETPMVMQSDITLTYSQLSAKTVFLDRLLTTIIEGTKENFAYIHSQTLQIQIEIDKLLEASNSLSVSLQQLETKSHEDELFIQGLKGIDEPLYSKEDQGLETFYNYFVMPLAKILKSCHSKNFAYIDNLLLVARCRDRAERMYNELFGTHQSYQNILSEENKKLRTEHGNLGALIPLITPIV